MGRRDESIVDAILRTGSVQVKGDFESIEIRGPYQMMDRSVWCGLDPDDPVRAGAVLQIGARLSITDPRPERGERGYREKGVEDGKGE